MQMQIEEKGASYLRLHESGLLDEREWEAKLNLQNCLLCPRKCGIDRESGNTGYCRSGVMPRVSSYGAHFEEEMPISGTKGSGAIFFSECTMGCIFHQNYPVNYPGKGNLCTEPGLSDMMIQLQNDGCHNINLISPTHFVPQIIGAVNNASDLGLNIPLVYNTDGYERPEIIRLLDGIVDIYIPEAKFGDNNTAIFLSDAKDYPKFMKDSIKEMYRQTGDLVCDRDGIAKRGLLVRHLVLPDGLSGTGEIFRFIAEEVSKDTYVNIMGHYRPEFSDVSGLDRSVTPEEYNSALDIAREYGLYRGF